MNDHTMTIAHSDDISKVLELGGTARRYRLLRRLLWLALPLGLAAGAYVLLAPASTTPKIEYKTAAAKIGELAVNVTATGTVQPTNQVDISSELSGTVRRVLVDFNDKVKAGQPLAELDTDKLKATAESSRAKLAAAKAKVRDTEATLEEKKLDFARKTKLYSRKISPASDLDVARAALARAEAAIDSAQADVVANEADLRLNETNLGKTRIVSPIDGVVLARTVEPGQTVASSLQAPILFTIAGDLTKMDVEVDVDEADVGQIAVGQPATFTVDAFPERKFKAKIKALHYGSQVVQGVVTYKAVLTADNSDLALRPGMTATAEINIKQVKGALLVPNAALRFSPAANEAFVDNRPFLQRMMPGPRRRPANGNEKKKKGQALHVLRDSEAKRVEVQIGATDGLFTQIIKGDLKAGEAVIIDAITAR